MLQLDSAKRGEIAAELSKMALLRGESVDDYYFELWVEQFGKDGYEYDVIMKIIDNGINCRKYGKVLAYGDLISAYKEKEQLKNINWREFLRVLKIYEEKALGVIQTLAGGKHITLEIYFKHQEYLENYFFNNYKTK